MNLATVNIMKKILTGSFLSFTSLLLLSSSAYAVDFCPAGQFGALCGLNLDNNSHLIWNVVNVILVFAAIASLFFLIWGGFKWITSGGDKAKIGEARATLTAAIVGLIIAFLALFIVGVVSQLFGIDRGSLFTLPRLIN